MREPDIREPGMRIVIDTNVLISGVFFGAFPKKIVSAVVGQKIPACATGFVK